jgi:hypothetical protein
MEGLIFLRFKRKLALNDESWRFVTVRSDLELSPEACAQFNLAPYVQ